MIIVANFLIRMHVEDGTGGSSVFGRNRKMADSTAMAKGTATAKVKKSTVTVNKNMVRMTSLFYHEKHLQLNVRLRYLIFINPGSWQRVRKFRFGLSGTFRMLIAGRKLSVLEFRGTLDPLVHAGTFQNGSFPFKNGFSASSLPAN